MGTALVGVDVVGEGENRFVVGLGPLHRQFQLGVLGTVGEVDHVGVEWLAGRVEVPDEIDQAPPVEEGVARLLVLALVNKDDLETTVEERQLTQPRYHRVVVDVEGLGEDVGVGPEGYLGTRLLERLALHHRTDGPTAGEALGPHESIPPNLGVEPDGEGVHHRDTDAVEAAGNLISAGVELPAGVEGAEHRGQRRLARLGVAIHRDAAPVVHNPDPSIGEEGHIDLGAEPGHGLVDRVVDHLPDQMVEAAEDGGPDVHPGSATDRLETLQDSDVLCVVGL